MGLYPSRAPRSILAASITTIASAVAPIDALPADVAWTGANGGYWDVAGNWNPGLPTAADAARLGAADTVFRTGTLTVRSFDGTGTLTVSGGSLGADESSSIGRLRVTGGGVGGAGALTVGTLDFINGQLFSTAAGSTTVSGLATFEGGGTQTVYHTTLNLDGGAIWTPGNGSLIQLNGTLAYQGTSLMTTMRIAAGSVFADQGTLVDGAMRHLGGSFGPGIIENAGTYRRTGVGTTSIDSNFKSSGAVDVVGGALVLNGGATLSGAASIASGASLTCNCLITSTGSITGAGDLATRLNTPIQNNGVIATTGAFSGSLLNSSGTTTVGSAFLGNGSYVNGSNLNVTGMTVVDGTGQQRLDNGSTLNLMGGVTWTAGVGTIDAYNGGVKATSINIGAGSVFTDQGLPTPFGGRFLGYYGDGVVYNAGTYNREGLGYTRMNFFMDNKGAINVDSGSLGLNGGTSSGSMRVAAGARLELNSYDFTLTAGSIVNDGMLVLNYPTITAAAGVSISGAGSLVDQATFRVLGDGVRPASLTMNYGTLGGTGTLTTGSLMFGRGTMGEAGQGLGKTVVTGGATFDGYTVQTIDQGWTLNLGGGATWTSSTGGTIAIHGGDQSPTSMNIAASTTFADQGTVVNGQVRKLGVYGDGFVNNAGTYLRTGLGTTQVDATFNNGGVVDVASGSMNFVNGIRGGGTLRTSGTGTATLGAASTTGSLRLDSTSAGLALGANDIAVAHDYANAAFGVGNAFDKRANVTGTGSIVGLGAAQAITGAAVTNGTTTNATLTIGSMRVGTTTYDYRVANTGNGADLRGALQTGAGGGSITDARLSGSGVTASNFGPIAAGTDSGALGVRFTATNAGLIAPLTGQTIHVANNFGNVAEQNLDIVIGAGATAYTTAAATVNPAIAFGIVHVGDTVSRGVSVTNSAAVTAANDVLVASGVGASGPFTASGALAGLAAGQTSSGALTVGLNTTTAGTYTGSASFRAASHDAELTDAALADLAVSLSGTVNNYASDAFLFGSGGGALSRSGSTFVLDYGSVSQGSATLRTSLLVGNTADGPADLLDGIFQFEDAADFGETGFGSFMDLVAGGTTSPLRLSFDALTVGSFTDLITLHGLGRNASGYAGAIGDLQLLVRGTVVGQANGVPEPDSWLLLGLGAPLMMLRRRHRAGARRQRH